MRRKACKLGCFLVTTILSEMLLVTALAVAQIKSYTPGEYPAPKETPYKMDATVEDLLPIARVLVKKPALRQPLEPGYGIKPGQRVLILVASSFDDRVLEAIRRAIEEVGGKPDVVKTWTPPRGKVSSNHGHNEIRLLTELAGARTGDRFGFPKSLVAASKNSSAGPYDLILNGSGGPVPVTPYGWEYIPWDTVDKFMFSQAGFPYEVQKAIDDKAWDLLLKSRKIRATDPEGTDMSWNWRPNYGGLLKEEWPGYAVVLTGHLGTFPEFLSPPDAEATGRIAGTINHTGTFPLITLTLKNNEILKVEGGGEYGKRWQDVLAACKNIQFPGFPGPGCGWFEEAALGSDVWRSRALEFADYTSAASWERGRAGVIHWGLGTSRNVDALPAVQKWLEENKTPTGGGHWHIHTYFTTMDFTMEDGKQVRILDKGRLTLLDDPAIRNIAAKYGDPDEILKEKWIPAVPGINIPGNYLSDYAQDPYKVIAAQQTELKKKTQAAGSQLAPGPRTNLEAKAR